MGLRAGVKKPPASFWKLMETAKMVARGCAGGAAGTPPWLLAGDSTPDRPACLRGYQYIPKVQRPKCPCGLAGHREQSAPINEREPSYPRRAGVNEPLALFLPAGLMRRRPRPPQRNGHVAIRKGRLMARAEEDCSCRRCASNAYASLCKCAQEQKERVVSLWGVVTPHGIHIAHVTKVWRLKA